MRTLHRQQRYTREKSMSWVLSATSLIMLWLMGNRSKWGPRLGILNQVLWIYYVVYIVHDWGLIVGVIAYTIVHIRNLANWEKNPAIPPAPMHRGNVPPIFCGECVYLFPTENEQVNKKAPHKCMKYENILTHGFYHPEIPILSTCKGPTL